MSTKRVLGWVLVVAAALTAAVLAVIAGVQETTSLGASLALALLSGCLQLGSGLAFNADTKEQLRRHEESRRGLQPDPRLVESTTTRLRKLAERTIQLSVAATEGRENLAYRLRDTREILGLLSVQLDQVADGVSDALKDWQFHPAAVAAMPPLPVVSTSPSTTSEGDAE